MAGWKIGRARKEERKRERRERVSGDGTLLECKGKLARELQVVTKIRLVLGRIEQSVRMSGGDNKVGRRWAGSTRWIGTIGQQTAGIS